MSDITVKLGLESSVKDIVKTAYDIGYKDGSKKLRDCVNELCLYCGKYKISHLGACDDCRWKKVKEELQ